MFHTIRARPSDRCSKCANLMLVDAKYCRRCGTPSAEAQLPAVMGQPVDASKGDQTNHEVRIEMIEVDSGPAHQDDIVVGTDLPRQHKARLQAGVAMLVENVGGTVLIHQLIEDGPAARSGVLEVGQRILSIDGNSVDGKTKQEVAKQIRGLVGTQVAITVQAVLPQHYTKATIIDVLLERAQISGLQSASQLAPNSADVRFA